MLVLNQVTKILKSPILKQQLFKLDNLSHCFEKGSSTLILGHNGAGKTTTIRLILGILTPDSGSITFNNKKVAPGRFDNLGFMPELSKFHTNLTCFELIYFHLKKYLSSRQNEISKVREKVNEVLKQVGLTAFAHQNPNSLSKGMQRRLSWILATVHEPSLLILDEPFSGLDLNGRDNMAQWIKNYKDKNTTLIICTHDLLKSISLATNLLVLKSGNKVFETLVPNLNQDGDIEEEIFKNLGLGITMSDFKNFFIS